MDKIIIKAFLGLFLFYSAALIADTCIVAGCNNELCVADTDNTLFSTCLWKAEYNCYRKVGICEADAQGKCGWRQTDELVACVKQAEYDVANADRFSD